MHLIKVVYIIIINLLIILNKIHKLESKWEDKVDKWDYIRRKKYYIDNKNKKIKFNNINLVANLKLVIKINDDWFY